MNTYEQFFADGRLEVDSGMPGPRVALMAGVHGNEPCGLDAFKMLLPNFSITKGSVVFLLGSRKAIEENVRAYECNLNRMFRSNSDLSEVEKKSYEYTRARELMTDLKDVDVLLDLHSSSASETEPFIICEPNSYELVAHLPVQIVASGFDTLHPMGTDAFVNAAGGQGICLECGNHNAANAGVVAREAVEALLRALGMKSGEQSTYEQRHVIAESIYAAQGDFQSVRSFGDFESVTADTVIGTDDSGIVSAQEDGCVIFVSDKKADGGEAFVFGREV